MSCASKMSLTVKIYLLRITIGRVLVQLYNGTKTLDVDSEQIINCKWGKKIAHVLCKLLVTQKKGIPLLKYLEHPSSHLTQHLGKLHLMQHI